MTTEKASKVLHSAGLRDTCGRRTVLRSLTKHRSPWSAVDVYRSLNDHRITFTTVYRILQAFERTGLVHRLQDDRFVLCATPGDAGHHALLRCAACDRVEEVRAPKLCKVENAIARSVGFRPLSHRSELVGTCPSCHHTAE